MAFTNNRVVFYNNKSFDEKLFANGLGMGIPSFVCKGLDLTGTTLTSGVFCNTGAFGQLGSEGETMEITANYTGYIVIKTTLNGSSSSDEIIYSATKLDTDQRDTSNVKYFTIYKLTNGVVDQEYRHINYVKSFELKNVGGSMFVWVLNGFTSEPFDASVLAGNRTLINDKDIGYDDSVHGTSDLPTIINDMFAKSQTSVGNDKPFLLEFATKLAVASEILPNLRREIGEYILAKTGFNIGDEFYKFTLNGITNNGLTNSLQAQTNYVTILGVNFSYRFEFDYDNWDTFPVVDLFNANTLDGLDSTQFIRKDQDDYTTGALTVQGNLDTNGTFNTVGSAVLANGAGATNAFFVDGTSGRVKMSTLESTTGIYYVTKTTHDASANVLSNTTLRMGDVGIYVNDFSIRPNLKQHLTNDIDAPIKQDELGNDVMYLIDVIDKLIEDKNTLEARVSALETVQPTINSLDQPTETPMTK